MISAEQYNIPAGFDCPEHQALAHKRADLFGGKIHDGDQLPTQQNLWRVMRGNLRTGLKYANALAKISAEVQRLSF